MKSTIDAKRLADMYKMGYSTLQEYLAPHRKKIHELATKRKSLRRPGKMVMSRFYNSQQLKYIIENILGDSPEGYMFNGESLTKAV